ncbi:MAG: protein kinase [Myxococcota bacterium]
MSGEADDAVGAVLNGQWKLIRLIGEGGLAAVYEAEGQQGQGRRAIKLLHPQYLGHRSVGERFYAEAQTCFNLRHPHIAQVEAYAYAEDGSPYLVMELLRGENLEDYLQRGYPMSEEVAAPILYGVLQALRCAHQQGVVHRDLKPPNLFLVATEPGQHTVKVLDFGIAKVMDVAGGMGSKTRTGAVLGTPGYMSPEQVKNAKGVDARSDLWAAGICFYEMLTCIHPFGAAADLARMVAVLRQAPTPIVAHNPQLEKWMPFFARALARLPEGRFQSADEMSEALRSVAQGTPARFVPDGMQTVAIREISDQRAEAPVAAPAGTPRSAAPPTAASGFAAPAQSVVGGGSLAPPPPVGGRQNKTENMMPAVPSLHASAMASAAVPLTRPGGVASAAAASPPAVSAVLAAGPLAGAPQGGGSPTQVSQVRPPGTPTIDTGIAPIGVTMARDPKPPSLVWWGVLLVAVGSFAAGILLGYALA